MQEEKLASSNNNGKGVWVTNVMPAHQTAAATIAFPSSSTSNPGDVLLHQPTPHHQHQHQFFAHEPLPQKIITTLDREREELEDSWLRDLDTTMGNVFAAIITMFSYILVAMTFPLSLFMCEFEFPPKCVYLKIMASGTPYLAGI